MSTISKISDASVFAEELGNVDDFDLTLTVVMLAAAQNELTHLNKLTQDLLYVARREQIDRKYYAKRRRKRRRTNRSIDIDDEPSYYSSTRTSKSKFPSWSELSDNISDNIFRRKYRMTKQQFDLLCERIQTKVGVDAFRPENNQGLGGKVRIAIGLRLLCGGSYLDLIGRAYGVESMQSIYNYFHTFIGWVDETFDFPLVGLLEGLNRGDADAIAKLKEMSSEFAADSDMCFWGCIGAIDGLAIRIRCPSNVSDPGNYFCRKNFYALNVQAICDRRKRILWISPGHHGSTHDSTAWQQTKLYDFLERIKDKLKENGFFIVGDSAYPLSTYMQVPYPNARPSTSQDSFNFWLSNSRIQIECTFGELIMRFGLFWRTLRFDLTVCLKIIRAASKLHNFLVDCREDTADDDNYFRNLSFANIPSTPATSGADVDDEDEMTFPLVSDNNAPKPTGRKSKKRKMAESDGSELRDSLCASLYEDNVPRPKYNRMRYNELGHVYFV